MSTPQSAINPDDDVRRQRLLAAMQQAMQPKRPQRQAWDERLPSGMSVPELLSRTQQQADVNGGQHGGAALGAPTVNVPPNAGLQPPTLPTPNINLGTPPAMPPAPGEGGYTSPPVRIGYGNAGLTGLDALQARRHALEEADPESKVTATGEILPPTPMSRWRGAATLGGLGMNAGDANHPLRELGGLLGGGIRGAISPRTAAKAQRQAEIANVDQQIGHDLDIQGAQAKVGDLQAQQRLRELQPAIENAKLELEDKRLKGVIDEREYQRQKDVLDRASREKIGSEHNAATIGAAKIRSEASKSGGGLTPYQQQEIADKQATRSATRDAKLNESSALYKKADNNEQNAKQLEDSLKPTPDGRFWDTQGNEITDGYEKQQEVARRKKQIDDLRNEARDLRTKGDAARAEGEKLPVGGTSAPSATPSGRFVGQKMSRTKLPEAAKRLNMTPEQAEQYIISQGGKVY